ncbi:MAG: ferric reductase-like transmembrane domain-containing protein [Proteobacteria bacterium]|nr:ferric reductase-like transmembrane domain-containing protein [Pseudomonadota bacterium]
MPAYRVSSGVTGLFQLLLLALIVGTSVTKRLRGRSFEAWWIVHHAFVLFYISLLIHGYGLVTAVNCLINVGFAGTLHRFRCFGSFGLSLESYMPLSVFSASGSESTPRK